MNKESYIAAISSYGTFSYPEKRYIAALTFSTKNDLILGLDLCFRFQVIMAPNMIEFKDEYEEDLNIEEAFKEFQAGLDELANEYDNVIASKDEEKRFIISVPELLTDFHIEILKVCEDDLNWMENANKIGILASYQVEGCGAFGEFLQVQQFCNQAEHVDSETEENSDCIGMTLVEKWNHLVGNGCIVPLLHS